MRKERSNWDRIQQQSVEDSVKYRDVYEDQQLERSKIQPRQSFTLRGILIGFVTVITLLLSWLIVVFLVNLVAVPKQPTPPNMDFAPPYYTWREIPMSIAHQGGLMAYVLVNEDGKWVHEDGTVVDPKSDIDRESAVYYMTPEEVPEPEWHKAFMDRPEIKAQVEALNAQYQVQLDEWNVMVSRNKMLPRYGWQWLVVLLITIIPPSIMYPIMWRNWQAQNMMSDTSDINQYHNDQHIALPQEVQLAFDWFPDVGAHCPVQVSSMISHVALSNKGIKSIKMVRRADSDILDDDGDILYLKGEPLLDDNGHYLTQTVPLMDKLFMESLFTASDVPEDAKTIRKYYDATQIPYNPDGKNRTKQGGKYATVADYINGEWIFPSYEPQRPGGAYLVDTEPVNTMILAITRAGKGQTVIEPTIDMWTRETRPNNIVINDPKGELLVKFYVKGSVRGFQPIQFNLINPMKTDIYNPLAMAAGSAKEGDRVKCAQYIENIADVFFPADGGDDPVWPNAANNAFKRAAYGLIDYFLEEEKELRIQAEAETMDAGLLESKIDQLWGKVTLYNCYQLFVQLTSKKMPNPAIEFTRNLEAGVYANMPDEAFKAMRLQVERKSRILWEDKKEVDLLTLYFNATAALPRNSMRTLVGNANDALRAMAGAEKMLASVYGIAITAMSFFTDPTISTLTSGTPSQNVDLAGLSFPRRIGVRFSSDFLKNYNLVGMQVRWSAYDDRDFTKNLGKDFEHEDQISREGWARYYFKGIFPRDVAYLKLEIINSQTGLLNRALFFQFRKSYQTSLDGSYYMKDPVLDEKIIKNGVLVELRRYRDDTTGKIVYRRGKVTFRHLQILDIAENPHKAMVDTPAIIQTLVRYSEKPKMLFLVTPPHLMKYAKLILILLTQLVNLNFDQSYMTKSNQKPFGLHFVIKCSGWGIPCELDCSKVSV